MGQQGRIFAIPDIHGRLDVLDQLLAKLKREALLDLKHDKLIFLGDMIDRGPDSAGVIERVRLLQDFHGEQRVIVLAGNHEWLAIEACRSTRFDQVMLWMHNGGGPTLKSFGARSDEFHPLPQHIVDWMAALPLLHEEPGFFFSHAPVPKDRWRGRMAGKPFTQAELTWNSDYPEAEYARDFKADEGRDVIGVCGHVHALQQNRKEPRFYPHYIFADAGCGCALHAPLVAIEVRSRKVMYAWPPEAIVTQSLEASR